MRFTVRIRKSFVLLALGIVILWGAFLRLYKIDQPSFWIDEAATVLQCRGILQSGLPKLSDGSVRWDSFPATYVQSLGNLFITNPHLGTRLPSAFAGIICIPLAFVLVRQVTRHDMPALLSALCLGLFHEQIMWSRQARPYIFVQLYMMLAIVLFFIGLQGKKKPILWSLTAICAMLAAFSHRAGYLAVVVIILLALFHSKSRILGSLTLLVSAIAIPVLVSLLVVGTNSNIAQTMRSVLQPVQTDYMVKYWRYLIAEYRSILVSSLIGVIVSCRVVWRFTIPLLVSAFLFFAVVSLRTWLFAHRYVFLLSFIVALFLAIGVWSLSTVFARRFGKRLVTIAGIVITLIVLVDGPLCLVPKIQYDLGYTAPAPPWRDAYSLIIDRHVQISGNSALLSTISAFPALHDIYLAGFAGQKWYIPINYSGRPNDVWEVAPYTTAGVIKTLEQILEKHAYVVLDDFALRMIHNQRIREYFLTHAPNAIVRSKSNIYIWIIGSEQVSTVELSHP